MAKSGMKYRVVVEVSGSDLGVVLEGLSGPSVKLVSVSPADSVPTSGETPARNPTAGTPAPPTRRYANGIRFKGTSSCGFMLELLATGPMTMEQLVLKFVERGFAASSASPAASRLKTANRIKFSADSNMWSRVDDHSNTSLKDA